jgi:hypothetical protein
MNFNQEINSTTHKFSEDATTHAMHCMRLLIQVSLAYRIVLHRIKIAICRKREGEGFSPITLFYGTILYTTRRREWTYGVLLKEGREKTRQRSCSGMHTVLYLHTCIFYPIMARQRSHDFRRGTCQQAIHADHVFHTEEETDPMDRLVDG